MPNRRYSPEEMEALEAEFRTPEEMPFGVGGELPGFKPVTKRRFSVEEMDAIEENLGRKPYSQLESTLLHAAKGRAYGVTPQIAGLGAALNEIPMTERESEAMGFDPEYAGSNRPLPEAYKEGRDTYRQMEKDAQTDNPNSAILGNILGLGSLRKAEPIKQGTALGAGYSDADLTEGEFEDFAVDTSLGTISGAGGKMLGPLASKGAGAVKDSLQGIANERALKAVVGTNTPQYRRMLGITKARPGDPAKIQAKRDKISNALLNEKPSVMGSFDRVENIAPKVYKAQKKYGKQMQDVANEVDNLIPAAVDFKKVGNELKSWADKRIPDTVDGKKLKSAITENADNFIEHNQVRFGDAQRFKDFFVHKADDASAVISNKTVTNKINSLIGKQMDLTAKELAESVEDPIVKETISQWRKAKDQYGIFAGASNTAVDRAQKNKNIGIGSPKDWAAGLTAAGTKAAAHGIDPTAVALGLGAGMASKLTRERGPAFTARTLDRGIKAVDKFGPMVNQQAIFSQYLGEKMKPGVEELQSSIANEIEKAGIPVQRLQNTPYLGRLEQAAEESPKSLAIMHYMLSSQDPAYQKLMEEGE